MDIQMETILQGGPFKKLMAQMDNIMNGEIESTNEATPELQ